MRQLFIICLTIFLLPFALSAQEKNSPTVETLGIGQAMPGFSLLGVDDKIYTADDFSEYNYLLVLFTCNHCPTAQAYEQRVLELYRDFNPEGVGFVAISPNSNTALSLAECGYTDLDDSFEAMKIRAKDLSLPFPYLYDGETSETSMKFGPVATPHVFIFDKERKLKYRGRIDDMESPYEEPGSRDTRNALNALIKGEKVPVETTKTFGCSVKWPWKDEWTKQLIKNWAEEEVTLEDATKESLNDLIQNNSGNLRLINVWATYCGPCIIEFPELVNTYRMYNNRGFDFVTISMDRPQNRERVEDFLQKQQASEMNYIWNDGTTYEAVDIIDKDWQGSLPYTLVIKPGGEIIYKHEGPVDILQLRKVIISELGRYFADDK